MARSRQQDQQLSTAIKLFQQFAKLNETGVLDESTVRMMQMPRCGHPDLYDDGRFLLAKQQLPSLFANNNRSDEQSMKNQHRLGNGGGGFRNRRYALQGSKWPKSKLRFKVGKYPKYPSMTREMIDSELQRAFDLWSNASDVEFEQVRERPAVVIGSSEEELRRGGTASRSVKPTFMDLLLFDESSFITTRSNSPQHTPPVDIEIRFETGYHGDSEPFDGSGLILGTRLFQLHIKIFNMFSLEI